MSGANNKMDNYIALKPVRLEDFRCNNTQSYPTPVQLVKHFSQLDQHRLNYAGGISFVNFTTPFVKLPEDEPSPLLQIPDWQLTSESSEDGESVFPWLPSHPQAVLQIPDGSEDFQMDHSEEEEDDDEEERSLSSPPPLSMKNAQNKEVNTALSINGAASMEENNSENTKPESDDDKQEKPKKRVHTCNVCKKSYRLAVSLEKHLKVPCELRPYKCEDCGKAFKRPDHLKAHSRMHTGERPFLCSLCGKTFRQKNHLQRHAERKHVHPAKVAEGEADDDNNSSFDAVCGLEDLEDDEMRSEDQD